MCQEKYTASSFKVSRALRNKLLSWGILTQFEDFYGECADFLHAELPKAESILQTMNSFANLLESRFAGQPSSLMGAVFFEISKFCAQPSGEMCGAQSQSNSRSASDNDIIKIKDRGSSAEECQCGQRRASRASR